MLSNIKLKNFKSYKEEQSIPLNKLTLLFGPNGGGKSSVIQSIMLQKRLLGENDSYTDSFTNIFGKQTYYAVENNGIIEDDLTQLTYTFKDYYYIALDTTQSPIDLYLFKSDIEIKYKFFQLNEFPIVVEIIEKKQSRFIEPYEESRKFEFMNEIEFAKHFKSISNNEKVLFSINNREFKKNFENYDTNREKYVLEVIEFKHQFYYQDFNNNELYFLMRNEDWFDKICYYFEKINQLNLKLFISYSYDEEFKLTNLICAKNIGFNIDLNDYESTNIFEDWFNLGDNFCVSDNYDYNIYKAINISGVDLRDDKSGFLKLYFGNQIFSQHFKVILNMLSPLKLFFDDLSKDDLDFSMMGSSDYGYNTGMQELLKMNSPFNIFKLSKNVPPLRVVPNKINITELNKNRSEFKSYLKLYDKSLYESISNIDKVNGLIEMINKNISLYKLEPRDKKELSVSFKKDYSKVYFNIYMLIIKEYQIVGKDDYLYTLIKIMMNIGDPLDMNDEKFVTAKKIFDELSKKENIYDKKSPNTEAQLVALYSYLSLVVFSNNNQILSEMYGALQVLDEEKKLKKTISYISSNLSYSSDERKLIANQEILKFIDKNYIDYVEILIYDKQSNILTRLTDIGFGFSQLFPIIIESAILSNRLIMVEQPELHLHPGLQANLAPMFIKSVKENNNQVILETHSEHLIKAVQLEVAKYHATKGNEGISKDEVSMVYISRNPETGASEVKEMKLDEAGSFIDPWPDDFFESSSDLTYERLRITHNN